jgi:hypothetical protein
MNWLVRPSARDAAVLFKTVAERNDKQVEVPFDGRGSRTTDRG